MIAGGGQIGFERQANDNQVIFLNRYIKDSEIAYLYQHAACVVYPYISATQSGVLSLAFYYQVSVLASDVPFFKGIIGKSETGLLFENGNVEDLQQQLLKLLSMNVKEMKARQKSYYENNYDGNSIHENLLKIYGMEWTEKDLDKMRFYHEKNKF